MNIDRPIPCQIQMEKNNLTYMDVGTQVITETTTSKVPSLFSIDFNLPAKHPIFVELKTPKFDQDMYPSK